MKPRIKSIACLFLLSFFVFALLTGCRQSPLLEQVIYVDRVEPSRPDENNELEEEKDAEEKQLDIENQIDEQQAAEGNDNTELELAGAGETVFGADLTEGDGASPQVVTDGGMVVEVPESRALVTTVSEATQNPHWKSSIAEGSGQYTGETAEGGAFQGQGVFEWNDGEKYEGNWKNGMFSGQGTYTWMNGDQYEGEWKTEVFSGQGTYRWISGSSYNGEWKDGVKEGHGIYLWANGDRYEGEWKAGVKEGNGTYTWADGSVYEGQWKYGIKEGQGKYRGADGLVYDGTWANDQFVN